MTHRGHPRTPALGLRFPSPTPAPGGHSVRTGAGSAALALQDNKHFREKIKDKTALPGGDCAGGPEETLHPRRRPPRLPFLRLKNLVSFEFPAPLPNEILGLQAGTPPPRRNRYTHIYVYILHVYTYIYKNVYFIYTYITCTYTKIHIYLCIHTYITFTRTSQSCRTPFPPPQPPCRAPARSGLARLRQHGEPEPRGKRRPPARPRLAPSGEQSVPSRRGPNPHRAPPELPEPPPRCLPARGTDKLRSAPIGSGALWPQH